MKTSLLSLILCLGLFVSSCTINPLVRVSNTPGYIDESGKRVPSAAVATISGGGSLLTDVQQENLYVRHGDTEIAVNRTGKSETKVAMSAIRWTGMAAIAKSLDSVTKAASKDKAAVEITKSNNATTEVLGAQEVQKAGIAADVVKSTAQ